MPKSDGIRVPYYNRAKNQMSDFYPDFIFWSIRGNDYHIAFVDPKGTSHSDYMDKVDGFRTLFEEPDGSTRLFNYKGWKVRFSLALETTDRQKVGDGYRAYWIDHPRDILQSTAST